MANAFLIIPLLTMLIVSALSQSNGYESEMNAANELENSNNKREEHKQSDVESLRRLLYKYLSNVDSMMADDEEEGHEKRDYSSSGDEDEDVSESMRISDHELANIDKFLKQNMPEFYLKELSHDGDADRDSSYFVKRDSSSSSVNAAAASAAALSGKTNKKVRQTLSMKKENSSNFVNFLL